MITIKTKEEIEILREGGRRLAAILVELVKQIRPGMTSLELDKIAQALAEKGGDKSAFLGYRPRGVKRAYPASLCVSINNEVVHGIPSAQKVFREGDVVAIDMGLIHKKMYTDHAVTVLIGPNGAASPQEAIRIDADAAQLIEVTQKALDRAIEAVKPGNRVGDIGAAIEAFVKPYGYGHAEGLAGHGVGYKVHEDPFVPNTGKKGTGELLKTGMVIAIEPMLNEGTGRVIFDKDEYTVRTKDGKRSAHFEHTVAVTDDGHIVLTKSF